MRASRMRWGGRMGFCLILGVAAGSGDWARVAVYALLWAAGELFVLTYVGVARRHDRQLRERLRRVGR